MMIEVTVNFLCKVDDPETAKKYMTDILRRRLKQADTIVGYTIQSHTVVHEI